MPSECIFEFDHPNKVYFSGETISGRVKLHTTRPKHVRSIYLLFNGIAKVRLGKLVPGKIDIYDIIRNDQVYVKERNNIFSEGRLPPGRHTYNFSISLPAKCETSCTEKYGEISYIFSLHIERELRYHNVFWQPVMVIKPLNLNCDAQYLTPIKGENIKYVCCFPFASGPIISTLSVPFNGWAPGQDISYTLKIDNKSKSYDVDGTKLNFVQTYKFYSEYPKVDVYTLENNLDKLQSQDRIILRRTQREFKGRLRIPSVPPSTLDDDAIIQISYRIGVQIRTGDCHMDAVIWIPITIGTIPLTQSVTSAVGSLSSAPTSPDMPPAYDMCMPASYQEPTLIGEKFKDMERDKFYPFTDWMPKYPVYNKFTDDLSIQIAGLQNLTPPGTNLFQSEVIEPPPPPPPLAVINVDEQCKKQDVIESRPLILTDIDLNGASTSRNCQYGFTDVALGK